MNHLVWLSQIVSGQLFCAMRCDRESIGYVSQCDTSVSRLVVVIYRYTIPAVSSRGTYGLSHIKTYAHFNHLYRYLMASPS